MLLARKLGGHYERGNRENQGDQRAGQSCRNQALLL
jgi:hypothetical protein